VSDEELLKIPNQASHLLHTSRAEAFALAPLEANACVLSVVGIAEGVIRETVRDGLNGFLVEPDTRSIAAAPSRLLDDPELARRLGEQGSRFVQEEWNVEGCVDRLEAQFLEITSQ